MIFQVKFSNIDISKYIDFLNSELIHEHPKKNDIFQSQVTLKVDKTPVLVSENSSKAGLEFKSIDDKRVYAITSDSFSLTIFDNSYTKFSDEFKDFSVYLEKFLEEANITSFTRVAIRKINLFEFSIPDQPPIQVLDYIFNSSVIRSLQDFPSCENVDIAITRINFIENNMRMNLSYGLNQLIPDKQNAAKRLASLDIDIFNSNEVNVENYKTEMNLLNDSVFYVFSYMISGNIKNLMNTRS